MPLRLFQESPADRPEESRRVAGILKRQPWCCTGQRYLSVNPRPRDTVRIELLLRMKDGDAIIPPGEFLPAAERYSLMPAADRSVISTAFTTIPQRVSRFEHEHPLCAIDLSGASLNSDTRASFVHEQAAQNGIDGSNACFEITETRRVHAAGACTASRGKRRRMSDNSALAAPVSYRRKSRQSYP